MAARKSTTTAAQTDQEFANAFIPAAWGDAPIEQIAGRDLVEKASLVGQPFLIERVSFEVNERGNEVAYVDALDAEGNKFSFNDFSAKGIRGQLAKHVEKTRPDVVKNHERVDVRIAVLRGVRASTFDVIDQATGKPTKATTFYLSASGLDDVA